jgi:hypothetical protein
MTAYISFAVFLTIFTCLISTLGPFFNFTLIILISFVIYKVFIMTSDLEPIALSEFSKQKLHALP